MIKYQLLIEKIKTYSYAIFYFPRKIANILYISDPPRWNPPWRSEGA